MQASRGLHRLRMPCWRGSRRWSLLAGCATRPINPPVTDASLEKGYTFQTRQKHFKSQDNLVVLAFSGGGTRAAAFSYGVLEFLRRTEAVGPKGDKVRLLDAVSMITGVSGGSFTALAYGLYGDKLFDDYEQRFLKRDVQGELIRARPQSGLLGRSLVADLGPFRARGPAVRRDPVQRRDLRRPRPRRRPVHRRVGDRHRVRRPGTLQPERLERAVRGSQCRAAVPRRRGIVCGPRGAVPRHDQQLRRHLQLFPSALGQDVQRVRESAAARSARDTRAEGHRTLQRQRQRVPISTSWTAACPTTWACAACSTRWNCSRPSTTRASRRRSTT